MHWIACCLAALGGTSQGPLSKGTVADPTSIQFRYFVNWNRETPEQIEVPGVRYERIDADESVVHADGSYSPAAVLGRLKAIPGVKNVRPRSAAFEPTVECRRSPRRLAASLDRYSVLYREFYGLMDPKDRPESSRAPRLDHWGSYLWWLERRGGELSSERRVKGIAAASALPVAAGDGVINTWEYVGPDHIQPPTSPSGFGPHPVSGRVNATAYLPNSATVIYAGTAGGGLWKSSDRGDEWTPKSEDWGSMCIGAIAIHPTSTGIVYAGTGDPEGWIFNYDWIYKSTDAGASWTKLAEPPSTFRSVADLDVLEDSPSIVIASTTDGTTGKLFRSTNSGSSWTALSPAVYDVDATLPFFGNRVLFGVGNGPTLYRSSDDGATWTAMPVNLGSGKKHLVCSRTAPTRVFVVNATTERVYRSDDSGNTLIDMTSNLASGADTWRQADSYNLFLAASKAPRTGGDIDVLFLGTIDVFQWTEGESSWRIVSGPVYSDFSRLHTDQHGLAFSKTQPLYGLVGNDGGVYELQFSSTVPGGVQYDHKNTNRGTLQFYGFDVHPTNKWMQIAGAQDNGSPYRNGMLDDWDLAKGGDGGHPVVKDSDPSTQLACSQYLSQQENGDFFFHVTENTWQSKVTSSPGPGVPNEMPFIPEVESDPTLNDRVYVGGYGLYRYAISSDTWTGRLGNFDFGSRITAIAVSPVSSSRLFVAAGGELYTSSNTGSTWTNLGAGPVFGTITSIAPSHSSSTNCLVTVNGNTGTSRVYDVGFSFLPSTWTDRTGDLPDVPFYDIIRLPDDPLNDWWIATDIGVFSTANRGASWLNRGGVLGLPNVIVTRLEMADAQNFVYASTYGRGLWRYGFDESVPPSSVSSFGTSPTGSLASILTADGSSYTIKPQMKPTFERGMPIGSCAINVDTPSPVRDPSRMTVSHRFAQTSSLNRVQLQVFDYGAGRWVTLGNWQGTQLLADRTTVLSGSTLSRYISVLTTTRWRFLVTPRAFKASPNATLSLDYFNIRFDP